MSEQEQSLVERLAKPIEPPRYETTGTGISHVGGEVAPLSVANAERAEALARITHLQAVVEAWRELELVGQQMSMAHAGNMNEVYDSRDAAHARLVALNQIEPVREGEYLKLKGGEG